MSAHVDDEHQASDTDSAACIRDFKNPGPPLLAIHTTLGLDEYNNLECREASPTSVEDICRDASEGNENRPPEDKPLLNDISSFLEIMHSKNITLKKLIKKQQVQITQLTLENDELRYENYTKGADIRMLQMQLAGMRPEPDQADNMTAGRTYSNLPFRQDGSLVRKKEDGAPNAVSIAASEDPLTAIQLKEHTPPPSTCSPYAQQGEDHMKPNAALWKFDLYALCEPLARGLVLAIMYPT